MQGLHSMSGLGPPIPERRDFFRRLLLRGVEQVEKAGQAVGRRLTVAAHDNSAVTYLRPPGALAQPAFADVCSRCARCVQVCPAQCIVIDHEVAGGLPHIVARQDPCVLCDELSCMKACPSGALVLVEQVSQIKMGLAVVDHKRCLRRPDQISATPASSGSGGADCQSCVVDCPLSGVAIGIGTDGRIEVRPGCVGCGVCERVCPTEPASITIVPA